MPVYRSVILQVLVRRCPTTHANAKKGLLTSRRPASEETVAQRRLDGVVELAVSETVLVDDILLGVHRRFDVVRTVLTTATP